MTIRDETYHKFGPFLLEAMIIELHAQNNELRVAIGMQPMPIEAFYGKINNNINHLEPYEWDKEYPDG